MILCCANLPINNCRNKISTLPVIVVVNPHELCLIFVGQLLCLLLAADKILGWRFTFLRSPLICSLEHRSGCVRVSLCVCTLAGR